MIFNKVLSKKHLSLMSGILIGSSYPPGFGLIALFGLVPLIRIWIISSPLTSLKYSFFSSLVCSIISLYWIGLNSGASFIPVLLSLIAAVLYLSIFWAVMGYITSWFQKYYKYTLYLIPLIWVSMEFVKSYGPLAFSWSSLALTQTNFLPILQIIDITGPEGISFWVLLINITIYSILFNRKQAYMQNVVLIFFIIIPVIYGLFIISSLKESFWDKKEISVIQPNIDPNLKWELTYRDELYNTMDSLNVLAFELYPDLVLWPEAALPNYMRVSSSRKRYEKIVVDRSIPLLMGTLDFKSIDGERRSLNGSIYFDGSDKNEMYHKLFLVPFAEYIPMSSRFPILKKLNFGQGNFVHGKEYSLFKLDSLLFSNLICYDLSNPLIVKNFIKEGARFLTVQANIAWLQNSSGVRQFFEMAKLRAVENRAGIAISANTGISGIISPIGEVTHKIQYDKQAVIKGEVLLNKKLTFYSMYGNIFSKICFLLIIVCFVIIRLNRL